MILTGAEMKALEERAFAAGASAEVLMEEAGRKIAEVVQQFCPYPGRCLVYFGKGHNGGDALVAARYLSQVGWEFEWRPAFPEDSWAPLTLAQAEKLQGLPAGMANSSFLNDGLKPRVLIVLDGLLGIGAGGALRDPIRSATREINALRATSHARVFALDLPTGLDADSGAVDPDAVVADCTLTIGFAKRGLLADGATGHVGRLAVLPLDGLSQVATGTAAEIVASPANLAPVLPRRRFDLHKGGCGRVGIVAGSRGLTGAARLAAEGCVRSGAGLISLFVTEDIYPVIAAAAAPEVMVRPVKSYLEVLDAKLDVLAVGPGLGLSRANEVRQLLERTPQPMVIDADALNALAASVHLLGRCAGSRLLTPHPGEMARLLGEKETGSRARRAIVEDFTARYPVALLLKGARTLVGQHGQPLSYNSTGSPGMATGGMGDVLTGVCAALAAQGLALYDAARVGAWLCGRAAELALTLGRDSEESLTPTALLAALGPAFAEMRSGGW